MSAVRGEPLETRRTTPGERVVVMGVSGCGKTTVGGLLAVELAGSFIDGDALHPAANIEKMSAGIPLDDDDREPWLREVGVRLGEAAAAGLTLIVGCSALKRSYRDLIRDAAPDTRFVHLHGTAELLRERMQVRPSHFMPTSLLDSQLETLENLSVDEAGRVFDIASNPQQLATDAVTWLGSEAPTG